MKKIAFHVEKGGTGKTTMCGNIGFELSHYNRSCIVDADPQGNLSSWLVDGTIQAEFADFFSGGAEVKKLIVSVRENLVIVPTFGAGGYLKEWSETKLFQDHFAFHRFIEDLEAAGIKIAVFDLSPGISNLERRILAVMDEIIPVVTPEYFAVDGMEIFEHELDQVRQNFRTEFTVNKMVINRVNNAYSLHKGYTEALKARGYEPYIIGQSTAISDCVPYHETLFEYDPGNRFTSEFQRLAQDIYAQEKVTAE